MNSVEASRVLAVLDETMESVRYVLAMVHAVMMSVEEPCLLSAYYLYCHGFGDTAPFLCAAG